MEFKDQVDEYCGKCSGALPLPGMSDARGGRDEPNKDMVSPGNLVRLEKAGSPKIGKGGYVVFDEKLTAEDIERMKEGWQPRSFRPFVAHKPEDYAA